MLMMDASEGLQYMGAMLNIYSKRHKELEADNARLREALEKIAQQQIGEDVDDPYPEWEYAYEQVVKVARAALGR
jgi:hypothetical protein